MDILLIMPLWLQLFYKKKTALNCYRFDTNDDKLLLSSFLIVQRF